MVAGRDVGDRDDPESGALRGERAGVRVLERDRLAAAQPEVVEDEPVEVGLGLRGGHVLAARDEVEALEEAQPPQVALDVRVAGVRGEPDPQPAPRGLVDQRHDPGQYRLRMVAGLVEDPPLGLERVPVGPRAEGPPRVERVVGVAHAPGEERPVEGHAVGPVDVPVGVDERASRCPG